MHEEWTSAAACRQPGVDPEWFFPVAEVGPALADVARAKAVCARCAVARECLAWALREGEPDGVWGGTTPRERRRLRRVRMAPLTGVSANRTA